MSSTLNCLQRRGVEGVGRVIQHATGAADLDRVLVAGAGRTVLGGARDLYVVLLSVGGGPRVMDQSVVLAALRAVAHQHHGVVDIGLLLVAAIENA